MVARGWSSSALEMMIRINAWGERGQPRVRRVLLPIKLTTRRVNPIKFVWQPHSGRRCGAAIQRSCEARSHGGGCVFPCCCVRNITRHTQGGWCCQLYLYNAAGGCSSQCLPSDLVSVNRVNVCVNAKPPVQNYMIFGGGERRVIVLSTQIGGGT